MAAAALALICLFCAVSALSIAMQYRTPDLVGELSKTPRPEVPLTMSDISAARAVGEPVQLPEIRVTVTEAHLLSANDPYYQARTPEPGKVFLSLKVRFENNGSAPVKLSALDSWAQGAKLDAPVEVALPGISEADYYPSTPIVPGETFSTTLVHELPASAGDIVWIYQGPHSGQHAIVRVR